MGVCARSHVCKTVSFVVVCQCRNGDVWVSLGTEMSH